MTCESRSLGRAQLLKLSVVLLLAVGLFAGSLTAQTVGQEPAQPHTTDPNSIGPTFTVSDLPSGRPLRVIVYGDMRFTDPSNTSDTTPVVRKWLAQKVGEERPDVLLLTGDMPFHGSNPNDWKVYEQETAPWSAEHLRVYPTIGNHEVLTDVGQGQRNYFKAYPQIANSNYYSVRIGNVYLITLDTTNFLDPRWPQREWLDRQLSNIPDSIDFVFFLFHVPMIADLQTSFMLGMPTPGGLAMRQHLEAQAAKSHAKFVIFNGHIHNYERFEMNGITHVITGGGGARPYPIFLRGDQDLYREHTYPNFNYVLITVAGKHAEAKMYRVADPYAAPEKMYVELKDTFNLDAK